MPDTIVPQDLGYAVIETATHDEQSFSDTVGEADTLRAARDILIDRWVKAKKEPHAERFFMHRGGAQVQWYKHGWLHTAYIVRLFE